MIIEIQMEIMIIKCILHLYSSKYMAFYISIKNIFMYQHLNSFTLNDLRGGGIFSPSVRMWSFRLTLSWRESGMLKI